MLLAVDTSTAQIGLALYDGDAILGEMLWRSKAHHTRELAPAAQALLEKTGHSIQDVKVLAVALGPGSFTSLRVGLSFVKGLALARNIPIIGIPTLDVIATSQPVEKFPLAAVLPSGRGRLAVGWYQAGETGWQPSSQSVVTTADELAEQITSPTLVCGELTAEERQRLARKFKNVILPRPAACVRRPAFLAELGWQRWQAGETDNPAALAPIYLHMPGAELA